MSRSSVTKYDDWISHKIYLVVETISFRFRYCWATAGLGVPNNIILFTLTSLHVLNEKCLDLISRGQFYCEEASTMIFCRLSTHIQPIFIGWSDPRASFSPKMQHPGRICNLCHLRTSSKPRAISLFAPVLHPRCWRMRIFSFFFSRLIVN